MEKKDITKYVRITKSMDKKIKKAMDKKDFENFGQFARFAFLKAIKMILGKNNEL